MRNNDLFKNKNKQFMFKNNADYIMAALIEQFFVVATNLKGEITYVNDIFCQSSLYQDSEVMNKDLSFIFKNIDTKILMNDISNHINNNVKLPSKELACETKNGDFQYEK